MYYLVLIGFESIIKIRNRYNPTVELINTNHMLYKFIKWFKQF